VKFKLAKTVGITGSTGFLGSVLKKKIINSRKYRLKIFEGNITNKLELREWFKKNKFDYFIHLAAVVPTNKVKKNPSIAKIINITGTKNIIREINKSKTIKWLFYSSTSHVYKFNNKKIKETSIKKPFSIYGKTKLKAEMCIKKNINNKTKFCIGRIFSLEGKQKDKNYFIPGLVKKIKEKKIINLDGSLFRDFIHVEDVADVIIKLLKNETKGEYNIASGEKTEFTEIIKIFKKVSKKKLFFNDIKSLNSMSGYADISKINKKINWTPKIKIKHIIKEYSQLL
tara:strand:- start:596 stop:1447 length:852 start_codon:yes stop_codon:yes gene_type:complete